MAKNNNDMRSLLGKMRNNGNGMLSEKARIVEKQKSNLTMRDLLKKTRKLNEDFAQEQEQETQPIKRVNKATPFDQDREETAFKNFFSDMTVSIKFIPIEIFDDLVTWGGTIDGMVQFMYSVTADEASSGIDFNYLEGFSPENPDNAEIIKKIETYYDIFYKYWRDNADLT